MYSIKKSTLGSWNRGQTSSKSNCYYKGSSSCWLVIKEEEEIVAYSRKKDAVMAANYFNEIKWDGKGDPTAIFLSGCVYEIDDVDKVKEV